MSVCLPHAALIPTYWDLPRPVRLPLPIIPGVNDTDVSLRWIRAKLVVQTRSPDVVRDCDLFQRIEENGGRVQVNMTVTTDDEDISRTFEPSCPSNMVRLRAIKEVQAAGIDTCITMTPLLLVNNNDYFADELIGTGVEKFIAQPFHFRQGKFLAGTRDGAYDLMAEKLGCGRDNFGNEYLERYSEFFEVLNTGCRTTTCRRWAKAKAGLRRRSELR